MCRWYGVRGVVVMWRRSIGGGSGGVVVMRCCRVEIVWL